MRFTSEIFENDTLEYREERGYGFVEESYFYPVRQVSGKDITCKETGFYYKTGATQTFFHNENDYNYGGMIFRYKAEPGVYRIKVTMTEESAPVWIAVTGMHARQIEQDFPWDPAGLVEKTAPATIEEHTWSYDFVSGNGIVDIEIEPQQNDHAEISVAEIEIMELKKKNLLMKGQKPAIFTLGDSTVQSFVFEEAIMSGWGQLFDDFFEITKVNVINYSVGGRSVRNMYHEGRWNDLLLTARAGDTILLQSGHNDESRDELKGKDTRFGRGNDEDTYIRWMEEVYIPGAKVRGVHLIFVTPMTRIEAEKMGEDENVIFGGFQNSPYPGIHFPGIMKRLGDKWGIPIIDLYESSLIYLRKLGGKAAKAMFLAVEAGETPGKTNSGSFANGNPSGNCDGTHGKEALSKQWCRLILQEIVEKKMNIAEYLKPEVKKAVQTGEERELFWEISKDVQTGENAYYRNQIEKMIKNHILTQDSEGFFHPKQEMKEKEFKAALSKLWDVELGNVLHHNESMGRTEKWRLEGQEEASLTRQNMAYWVVVAYEKRFGKDESGNWRKPVYMTDYNGVNLSPDSPYYDPNLDGESAQYYPMVSWEHIEDKTEAEASLLPYLRQAYELGLMRSETGIVRGRMQNGKYIEPRKIVTREKAAKELFFLSVLIRNRKEENDK